MLAVHLSSYSSVRGYHSRATAASRYQVDSELSLLDGEGAWEMIIRFITLEIWGIDILEARGIIQSHDSALRSREREKPDGLYLVLLQAVFFSREFFRKLR